MDTVTVERKPRSLVLCFDGTASKYDTEVSCRTSRKTVFSLHKSHPNALEYQRRQDVRSLEER